jgi:hypothetical protein
VEFIVDSLENLRKKRWKKVARKARRVEFEEVELRLPRTVIEYVSRLYGDPRRWLEYYVVDWIRIDVETKTEEDLIRLFNLGPAFREVLK